MKIPSVLLVLFFLSACGRSPEGGADQILVHGGTILTMNAQQPTVEAMLLDPPRIVALGSLEELGRRAPSARRHDLQGNTVLPGFVDSHVHVLELGLDRSIADLTGVASVDEMILRLRSFYPDPEPGSWLIGQGWDEGVWASKGYPDRAALDEAFPENPVRLGSLHGFAGIYNGAALAIAAIDASTPDPEVGTILRREDRSPTGVMLTTAQAMINQHIPEPGPEQLARAYRLGLEEMARAGVTMIHEAGSGEEELRVLSQLAAEGALPIRVFAMLNGNDDRLIESWTADGPQTGDSFLHVRGIKVFYDGSLGSRTALLREPYSDEPEKAEMTERISPERVRALAETAAKTGFQMAVHAIGDEGNDRALSIFEEVLAAHPDLDHRWRIEHAQVVLPDYYRRAAALGIVSSMQPSHAVGDSKWAEDRLGPERIRHAYAWRSILEAGAPLILNSDLPGEPWTPVETLYFAVTRQTLEETPEGGWYADQALSVAEALRAMTIDGAHAAFREADLGSLEAGKLADFVELDRDPTRVPARDLKELRVLRTWVGGRVAGGAGSD